MATNQASRQFIDKPTYGGEKLWLQIRHLGDYIARPIKGLNKPIRRTPENLNWPK